MKMSRERDIGTFLVFIVSVALNKMFSVMITKTTQLSEIYFSYTIKMDKNKEFFLGLFVNHLRIRPNPLCTLSRAFFAAHIYFQF